MRFYISIAHGDDNNPGTILSPWRTEEHARRQVNELEDEGDNHYYDVLKT